MQLQPVSVRLAGAALLLLAAAVPAAASDSGTVETAVTESATSTGTPATQEAKDVPAEPKRICRSIGATESRMKTKRICLTKDEWKRVSYK